MLRALIKLLEYLIRQILVSKQNCLVVRTNIPKKTAAGFHPLIASFHLLEAGLKRKQACDGKTNTTEQMPLKLVTSGQCSDGSLSARSTSLYHST